MSEISFSPDRNLDDHEAARAITAGARELGFIAVGFVRPDRPPHMDRFRQWIDSKRHGEMGWLARQAHLREDPTRLLKGCRTIISLAYPYSAAKPWGPDGLTVARFAEPHRTDYHDRLKVLGNRLLEKMGGKGFGSRGRVCVDSAPLLERSIAHAAGIGFFGKNSTLIVPGHGSYVFLVEILTTVQLPVSAEKPVESRCGDCTRCLDACPTNALEAPNLLNAAKCLSYLTIEYRGDVDMETGRRMDPCFFGCDVCQEVCPFNEGGLADRPALPSGDEMEAMEEEEFRNRFGATPLARTGLKKLQGNVRAIRSARKRSE